MIIYFSGRGTGKWVRSWSHKFISSQVKSVANKWVDGWCLGSRRITKQAGGKRGWNFHVFTRAQSWLRNRTVDRLVVDMSRVTFKRDVGLGQGTKDTGDKLVKINWINLHFFAHHHHLLLFFLQSFSSSSSFFRYSFPFFYYHFSKYIVFFCWMIVLILIFCCCCCCCCCCCGWWWWCRCRSSCCISSEISVWLSWCYCHSVFQFLCGMWDTAR